MKNDHEVHGPMGGGKQLPDKIRSINGTIIHWFILAFILLLALWVRMDDLIAWHRQPSRAFYQNQPILLNFDGYYYLSLARDLMDHAYRPIDPLRGVPEPQPRPWPPPLISVMAAAVSGILPLSLDWTGALLPPLLGLTLGLPLYLMGRLYGGPVMALVATCTGLCAQYYVYRSNLGWFDTDCLNVTFAFMITYLFIRFGLENSRRRFKFLTGGLILYGLFMLWWDQTRSSVTLICLTSLVIVLALFYRPRGRERWIALAIAIAAIGLAFLWLGPQGVFSPLKKAAGLMGYISKTQPDIFPNTGISIFEQKRLGWTGLVEKTTGHPVPFFIGIGGLAWLAWRQKQKAGALILLFVIGCLSFLFARRFLIFLNPFIALGLGFVAQRVWNLRAKRPYLTIGAPALAVALCFFPVKNTLGKIYWPMEIPPLIQGMDRLSRETESDALIWAWWDHGYPMRYWSQRATMNDGSLHSGRVTVCNAIPFAAENQRYAANFIHFYSHRGTRGLQKFLDAFETPDAGMQMLKKILQSGPDTADKLLTDAGLDPESRWRRFLFPPQPRNIYLYLDLRLARTTYWWYWFGTWDIGKQDGRHPLFRFVRGGQESDGIVSGPDYRVDLTKGMLTYRQKNYPLSQSHLLSGTGDRRTTYAMTNGLVFAFQEQTRTGAFMDRSFANSVFNQLFVLTEADPVYFSLAAEDYPYYQIWKVTPDRE